MLSPNSCVKYFKMGSVTRRHSVIGCIGYENANPNLMNLITNVPEMVDVGVGTSDAHQGNKENNITCAICLECIDSGGSSSGSSSSSDGDHQKKNVATTECGHTFCLSCLLKNLHTSNLCPLCRAPVEQNVKHVLKPLSYSDGIGLLDRQLNGLRIYEDVEQFVQNAMEVSSQPNTDGQNVEDVVGDIMTMITYFGFNLLYNATLHTNGSEEHMDPEWIIQMYDDDDDGDGDDDDSTIINDSDDSDDSDSDSDSESDSDDSDGEDDSKNKRVVLPEVPESMLEFE